MSDESKKEEDSKGEKLKYPKSIFFIVGNEFCERFMYYGLRTILTIYLTQRLYYSEDQATIVFHLFGMFAYFTPVIGAMIADSWLGKFNTIFYISILYAIGGVILSFGAFPQSLGTMKIISLVGLFVIGFATGGIKPCVSAFGGDQFKEGQERQLQQFFSVFYLSINLGSVIATFLTPILREDVHCLAENTCYPLAFGIPAILMILALLLFIGGKPFYNIRPPEGNIALKVSKCICYAVGKKFKAAEKKKPHWLDYADDKYDKNLIRDIKILFHVLVLYIPLPLFWALFDQTGSRWTLQATRMDGVLGSYHIKADQMQVINPFLIITFIPLFQYVVYPLLEKCNLLKKPLQRITAGGCLAAISFIIAGFIELNLESYYPVMPSSGYGELTIINNSPCPINIEGANLTTIKAFETGVKDLPLDKEFTWKFNPENCKTSAEPFSLTFNSTSEIESMMITLHNGKLVALKNNDSKTKSKDGEPQVRVFYNIDMPKNANLTFLIQNENNGYKYFIETGSTEAHGMSEYSKFPPGEYLIYAPYDKTQQTDNPVARGSFKSGGIYILSLYNREKEEKSSEYVMVNGNEISILWQIPQYVIITAGEIMFSITGLEFSYSQSPLSMKSVIQAIWLLTVAFGNLIVLVIAKLKLFEKQSYELFLFATLMVIDMVVFAILAYMYKYVIIKSASEEQAEADRGRSNEAYVEETDFNK